MAWILITKNLIKNFFDRKYYRKSITVILPCNPIFPIGTIYRADHTHKCLPKIEQQFIDLAIIPSNKVSNYPVEKSINSDPI